MIMPNIRHEVLIGASPEKVYDAITSAEGISAWWSPGTKATPETGSIVHIPFGSNYFKEMKITDLKPYKLVTWNCIAGVSEWIGTKLSFQFQPGDKKNLLQSRYEINGQVEQLKSNEGTLLIFHHDDWKEYTPMFAECSYTWGQFLRSLKLYCETGKGQPWPNQHRTELEDTTA